MPLTGTYEPSPWEPIAKQVEDYERTDGAEGADFMGGRCIILTSIGARSGSLRKTPLIRVTDGTSGAAVDPFDLATYTIQSGTRQATRNYDRQRTAYGNLRRDFYTKIPITLKTGFDLRESIRDFRGGEHRYPPDADAPAKG